MNSVRIVIAIVAMCSIVTGIAQAATMPMSNITYAGTNEYGYSFTLSLTNVVYDNTANTVSFTANINASQAGAYFFFCFGKDTEAQTTCNFCTTCASGGTKIQTQTDWSNRSYTIGVSATNKWFGIYSWKHCTVDKYVRLPDAPFTFIHMTDTHVYRSTQSASGDINGWEFGPAMKQIATMNPKPAFVAVTGDLVDFGAGGAAGQANYGSLTGALFKSGSAYYADASHQIPVYMIPGNHDPRGCSACVFESDYSNYDSLIDANMPHSDPYLPTSVQQRSGRNYVVTKGNTLLIFMDSGYDAGANVRHPNGSGFTDSQWSWLNSLVNLSTFSNKIIFMHHPAIDASGQWCDGSNFPPVSQQDATITYHQADLLYLLRAHPEVVVLAGHEHQNVVCDSYGTVVDRNAAGVARATQTGAGFVGNHRAITVSGSKVDIGSPQLFTTNTCRGFNGTYKIVNRLSGMALDVPGGSITDGIQLIQWPYHGGTNQRWNITPNGDGTYKIVNVNSGKNVDVSGGSSADGAAIIQWYANGGDNQKWLIYDIGGGYSKIISKMTGKAVVVLNASTAAGARIIQWTYNASHNDEWVITTP